GACMGIIVEDVERVLAHDDPEVVLRLREEAVGVDEFEPVRRFQRVPLMNVAMNKDGLVVAMRVGAPRCARDGVVDGALRAWVIQFLPGRRDEIREPATLLGAGWQTAARRASPDARRRRAEDLLASADRQCKLVERPSETFEQEC